MLKISSLTSTIQTKINHNYPNLSKNVADNYFMISTRFNDNYSNLTNKFNETCPTISSGLTTTRSTITSTLNNGTTYVSSLPASVTDKVYSYTSFLQPVDPEEKEVTRTAPNDNLAEGVITLNPDREEVVMNILDLYSCKPSKESFKHYDNEVTFEDNLIYSTGLASLKASFYGMPKIFVKSTTISYKILENTPNMLRVEIEQKYTLPYVARAIIQTSEIVLEFNGNQKIIKHSDLWSKKPIATESILVLRKGVAKLISALVTVPETC